LNTKYISQFGVTLVELLIVVSIVGILAAIGYPAYQDHVEKTRYADAKVKLVEIMQLQRRHFTDNSTYTENLISDLGYPDAGEGEKVTTDNEYYIIVASQCDTGPLSNCILLTANPNFGDGSDTPLTYNSRNAKTPEYAW